MSSLDDKIKKLVKQQGLEEQAEKAGATKKKRKTKKKTTKRKTTKRKTKKRVTKKRATQAGKKIGRPVKRYIDPEIFAHRYIQYHCNGMAAYLSLVPDVSEATASSAAHKLLKRDDVQAVIWPLLEGMLERESAKSDWVIKRWLEQAEASPLDYFEIKQDGSLGGLKLDQLSPAHRRNLRSIKYSRTTRTDDSGAEIVSESVSITVVDQQKAVESMAKMLGMLQPKLDAQDVNRIGDLLEKGVQRIRKNMDTEAWKALAVDGTFSKIG